MQNARKVLFVLACLVALTAAAICLFRSREPSYQGLSLTEWLKGYNGDPSAARGQTEEAVRQIGTNALPWLLAWLNYEEPGAQASIRYALNRFLGSTSRFRMVDDPKQTRAEQAACALATLGEAADQAVEPLAATIKANRRYVSPRAAYGSDARPAVPSLVAALHDWYEPARRAATNAPTR